ncbi:CHL4-domain-containing protein [Periconia macrospinosa]|uniref:CHL4-domain-containing protein n=1 Tax=Periconia macrospinosa TaxID=97972 RepID=A0A2V1EC97_9PLEO|nr:CHL4-domain-containing protein [Periconia macrospinosa]
MAPNTKASVPDYKNIPHAHRVPVNHREVQRIFSKLSRQSLISLALQWLAKKNRDFCRPYLLGDEDTEEEEEEEDEQYTPAQSLEELQEIYKQLAARKGGKREVQDRILEGDWRKGISMYQLATADIQYLLDHTNSLRWTAKRLARVPAKSASLDMEVTNDSDHLPRFQAQTFMANLARELTPLMKAHYLLTKIKTLPMTILRVYMHDSPYSTEASLATETSSSESAKAVFFIWPNGSPFVYSSIANHLGQGIGDDSRHLRDIVQQAIPKAFSRPSARYQLAGTNFTTKSLEALLNYRGSGKSNSAAGGWNVFQDHSFSQNALDFITSQNEKSPTRTHTTASGQSSKAATTTSGRPAKHTLDLSESSDSKRRREVAEGRFGTSALPGDGKGLERFEVRIDDAFPQLSRSESHAADENNTRPANHDRRKGRPSLLDRSLEEIEELEDGESWVPDVRVVFQGSHVFAGVRQLVEQGVVNGETMPGWMTGEAGVTVAAVKDGRIKTKKGHVLGV